MNEAPKTFQVHRPDDAPELREPVGPPLVEVLDLAERVARRVSPAATLLWLWLWRCAGWQWGRTQRVTLAQLAGRLHKSSRASCCRFVAELAAAKLLASVHRQSGRAGYLDVRLADPAQALDLDRPDVFRGDGQRPLPVHHDDPPAGENVSSCAIERNVSSVGGKGGSARAPEGEGGGGGFFYSGTSKEKPSSSSSQSEARNVSFCDTKRNVSEIARTLSAAGVVAARDVAGRAVDAGYAAEHVAAIVAHYQSRPGTWSPGAIVHRLDQHPPDVPADQGWPAPRRSPGESFRPEPLREARRLEDLHGVALDALDLDGVKELWRAAGYATDRVPRLTAPPAGQARARLLAYLDAQPRAP